MSQLDINLNPFEMDSPIFPEADNPYRNSTASENENPFRKSSECMLLL